jgi:methylmalonyl-CoA mutase
MERLTHDLMEAASGIIAECESLGGMSKAVDSGMPKLRIEESAAKRQARLDTGADVIVGMNKYVPGADAPGARGVDVLSIDNTASREAQVAMIKKIKGSRDESAVTRALDALEESAKINNTSSGDHPQNLLKLAIDAARVRATVGEISYALEKVWVSS